MVTSATDRIEQALARIEAAAARRAFSQQRLAQRHARLRGRVEEAIRSIDTLIEHETAGRDDG